MNSRSTPLCSLVKVCKHFLCCESYVLLNNNKHRLAHIRERLFERDIHRSINMTKTRIDVIDLGLERNV